MTVLVHQHHGTVIFGRSGAHLVSVLVGHVKHRAGHTVAVLVDLLYIRFRNGHQVVLKRHVGVCIAALKVEEIKRVVGVVGKGIARPAAGVHTRSSEQGF